MVEIADIFRLHGPAYREKFGDRLPKSPLWAMEAIEQCRPEALGGPVYFCENCEDVQDRDHSCKNRHGPTCQNDSANVWLEKQKDA